MVSVQLLTASLGTAALVAAGALIQHELVPVLPRSPDAAPGKTLLLQRTEVAPLSTRFYHRMKREQNTIGKRASAQMPLTPFYFQGYNADIVIDGQNFTLALDTATSDLWVPLKDYICMDDDSKPVDKSVCALGPQTFSGTPSGGYIAGEHFLVQYSDGETAMGNPGLAKVDLAGVSIDKQAVGFVNVTNWAGDNKTCGLLGLAYPNLTSTYTGVITDDSPGTKVYTDLTVLQNLAKKDPTYNSFAIAQDRKTNQAYLTFGGLPPVTSDTTFAKVPIRPFKYYSNEDKSDMAFYAILPDAYEYDGYAKPKSNSTAATKDPNFEDPAFIDPGSFVTLLHSDIVHALTKLFTPPAVQNEDGGWFAPCDAKAPKFGIKIGGTVFHMSQDSLLLKDEASPHGGSYTNKTSNVKYCGLGVQDGGPEPPYMLGATFLKNVVSVFDTGASEMRFAAIPE